MERTSRKIATFRRSPPRPVAFKGTILTALLAFILCVGGSCSRHNREEIEALRATVLELVDKTTAARNEALTPEALDALEEFKRAFADNPDPFDVANLAAPIPEIEVPTEIAGVTNYRFNADGTLGELHAALDQKTASTYVRLAEDDERFRHLLAGLCIREGTNVRNFRNPDVAFFKEWAAAFAFENGSFDHLFTQADFREFARAMQERRSDLLKTSAVAKFMKQLDAVTIHIEFLGFRAQSEYFWAVGLDQEQLDELARMTGLKAMPSHIPSAGSDERAVMRSLLLELGQTGNPVLETIALWEDIEGDTDFLYDPDFYEPRSLRSTIVALDR